MIMIAVSKILRALLVGVLALMLTPQLFSQSSYYTVEGFYRNYDTVDNFISLVEEGGYNEIWDYRVELNWEIPLFDTTFDHLNASSDAAYYTDESVDYTHLLMNSVLLFDLLDSPSNGYLESDARMMMDSSDKNNRVLIFEFRKARFATDTSIEEFDSYISFQNRFYENGDVEIHFGPCNLDYSSSYIPGEGIFLMTPFDTIQEGYIGLLHPDIEFNAIGIDGKGEDLEYISDELGNLYTLPPNGFVYKFKYNSATNTQNTVPNYSKSIVHPTLTSDFINVDLEGLLDISIEIYSMDGRLIYDEDVAFLDQTARIDIQKLQIGSYYLIRKSKESIVTDRFIKY